MKLHPHGSSYGSMVGMVQKDRHIIPMLKEKETLDNTLQEI